MRTSGLRLVLPLAAAVAVLLVIPAAASAYEEYYCGKVLAPRTSGSDECRASGLHSVDFSLKTCCAHTINGYESA